MRNISVFLILILITSSALATDYSLSKFGFEKVELNETNKINCQTLDLSVSDQDLETNPDPIMSIYANFVGEPNDNSYVSVKINDGKDILLWPSSFLCEKDCVSRVFVPELKKGEVTAKICLRTGGKSTAKLSNITLGLYNSPLLKIENSAPEEIILGQRAKIKIKVSNLGSIPADVFVQFMAEDLRALIEITSFDIVEGQASAYTTIDANDEKEFVFYIKPTKVSSYNLPSSVVFFTNIFGEKQKIVSNHSQLNVIHPNQIDLALVGKGLEENKFGFKVIIKNKLNKDYNGTLNIFPIDLIKENGKQISIPPLLEIELNLTTKELPSGEYSLLAEIDNNSEKYLSESISFEVVDNNYSFELMFLAGAILISILIFGLIYFEKI